MSIAIWRIADLRNNNDPSVGGGRSVGSGAMTGKRETDLGPTRQSGPGCDEEREAPCGPQSPETPPSNIKCRINAGHDRPASTAAAYVFSKPFFVLLRRRGSLVFRSRSLSSSAVFGASLSHAPITPDHFTLARRLFLSLVRFSSLSFFVLSFCGVP